MKNIFLKQCIYKISKDLNLTRNSIASCDNGIIIRILTEYLKVNNCCFPLYDFFGKDKHINKFIGWMPILIPKSFYITFIDVYLVKGSYFKLVRANDTIVNLTFRFYDDYRYRFFPMNRNYISFLISDIKTCLDFYMGVYFDQFKKCPDSDVFFDCDNLVNCKDEILQFITGLFHSLNKPIYCNDWYLL